jgi:hypothetical protein
LLLAVTAIPGVVEPYVAVVVALGLAVIDGEVTTVTESVEAELVPQPLPAVTVTLPEVAVPQLTVIEVVPAPAVIEAPLGTDQVYVVAPLTAEIV